MDCNIQKSSELFPKKYLCQHCKIDIIDRFNFYDIIYIEGFYYHIKCLSPSKVFSFFSLIIE